MDKDAPARPNQHQQSSRNQGGRGGIAGDTAARPKPARTPEKSSGYVRSYDNDGKAKSKKTIMKLGCTLLGVEEVPKRYKKMFAEGENVKEIYRWELMP